MNYQPLIVHLELFESGADRSVQWAKDAEVLLDGIEDWDNLVDDLQDQLALYRPGGGPHLIDEQEMNRVVLRTLNGLRERL